MKRVPIDSPLTKSKISIGSSDDIITVICPDFKDSLAAVNFVSIPPVEKAETSPLAISIKSSVTSFKTSKRTASGFASDCHHKSRPHLLEKSTSQRPSLKQPRQIGYRCLQNEFGGPFHQLLPHRFH